MNHLAIATGDSLFGSPVSQVFFVPGGLNDLGQIAFGALIEDGLGGIYIASPASLAAVPEPTSMLLLAVGALVTGAGMRWSGTDN